MAADGGAGGAGSGLLGGVAEMLEAVAKIDRTGRIGDLSGDLAHRASRIKEQLSSVVQAADTTPGVHHSAAAQERELARTRAAIARSQVTVDKFAAALREHPLLAEE
mmetsp:Transcript_11223/g.39061  ORF Transcript_11223/g.39061 Transcript_11223/m.39061 type:complete len:107 (-) Transcript_11223:2931-3251(-)